MTLLAIFEALVGANAICETTVQGQNLCGLSVVFVKDWRVVMSVAYERGLTASKKPSLDMQQCSAIVNF